MAYIEEMIDQISDPELRKVISDEVKKLKENKQFGLVFEHHIPEVVPVYNAPIRPKARVAKKTGKLNETFRVKRILNDKVEMVKDADGSLQIVSVNEIVVVKQFGDPIYPALIPIDSVSNGDPKAPHHILLEADNYHALQLLEYLYPGKIDCIYIDPPFNTGARDWKYNNDYVDKNDSWRHSKWLAMMKKRLVLAKQLLKEDGVLVCAIDDNELATLWLLLKDVFRNYEITCVTVVHHPRGTQGDKFSSLHEYALFVYKKSAVISDRVSSSFGELYKLRRWGSSSEREFGRNKCFYPIFVKDGKVVKIGEVPDDDFHPSAAVIEHEDGTLEFWPIDSHRIERKWRYARDTVTEILDRIFVTEINGEKQLQIGRASERNKTVWTGSRFDAGTHGSKLVSEVLGVQFPYPKSLYTVFDCIRACTKHNKNAIVVDFFAGSGTTLNAVNLLNAEDDGTRQCIMVTNNEVSDDESKSLIEQGLQPGQPEWEEHGICRSITWPRSKYTILGVRDDGSQLTGEYITNQSVEKNKPRKIKQIGFIDSSFLNTATKKKQLVALIEGIPQSAIKRDTAFYVSDDPKNNASILFDEERADEYLSLLDGKEHITDFYIITSNNRIFDQIKNRINEILGPIIVLEEKTRPMSLGFPTNLDYFKLDFLDPNEVALGRQFKAILPIIWMMAGAKGNCPITDYPVPWLIPTDCPFAILIQETKFKEFLKEISGKELTHIFLITNSEEAFFEMKAELNVPNVLMLYKNYLKNFEINRQWKD
ncbi:site-specific DNA-methyltransferase [Paenibacillus thermoaerophilus]|uniref:Site-specific DNA-methyltransferase n=1 Tax=Paenibacillus thermoaerophilus TaxID=1215385 RepID=A0ABW2V621_9BACL|nr:site-specific DNA-methyltransferase [Paenibacillus thermoaerophilus]TMV06631.1 site-specific DNA-methyltransferase [Paenibacillus thermoaerophilus]